MASDAKVALADAKAANSNISLKGKFALCVGGSSGCGLGTALTLARLGCKVTIVGRNEARGAAAAAAIKAASGEECEFISCDVKSFAAIKSTCQALKFDRLDFLTLSCTRGGIQGYKPTPEGYDERLMTMFLGRFAWVHALMPLLLKSEDPRILSILSAGNHQPYKAYESDFLTKKAGMASRTFAAGWYTDCACSALARAQPKLTLIHAFPGIVNTNWHLEMPWALKPVVKLMLNASGKKLEDCGEWMAYPLLQPQFASGCYLRTEHAGAAPPTKVFDDATCDGVWAKAVEVFEKEL